ncbi:Ninja-family protein AFP2 [Forsythia ovata]|uniref:Ninja-family protein n=1 Tax=Forsythia ovata TaxID=205694 RepID=A0ABD1Q8M1_9LAMI
MRNFSSNRSSSRDLLQRFVGSSSEWEEVKEEEEIELNLGLSLGGRFGVDKGSKKLVRSSSIAECLPVVRDDNDVVPPVAYTGLVRTSSLPVETEEEWRKRKELQMLRRMEAKKRRSEKQRNVQGDKECGGRNLSLEEKREIEVNLRERLDKEKFLAAAKKLDSSIAPPFRLSMWATATAGGAVFRDGIEEFGQLASQGSVESKGWSSLSVSELDCKTLQGSSSGGEFSPASIQPLQEGSNHNVGSYGTKARENRSRKTGSDMESPSKRPDITRNPGTETGMNVMQDMPCVFTKGDGPNGRKVEGILYKYGKGEEVKIMCICHGSFLSPAEFVKHAGVSDVDQPLKHIVVNPNASSLL